MNEIRVSIVAPVGGFASLEEKWDNISSLLDLAARESPDLVVLPEALNCGFAGTFVAAAVEVPGPESEMFARWAREHGCHVLLPLVERYRGRVRNSAILLDRKGEVSGRYFKTFPTIGELEEGVVPGEGAVALEADFGPIGAAICYDANFTRLFAQYEELGVKLVCFVSMFSAGTLLNAYAVHHGYHIVSAYTYESRFIDPGGRTTAVDGERVPMASGNLPVLLTRTIDLDTLQVHLDEIGPHLKDLKEKRAGEVSFEMFRTEGFVLLRTHREDLPARAIVDELGLETRQEYLKRATKLRDESLQASTPGAEG